MDFLLAYCSFVCTMILATDGVTLIFEMKSSTPLKGSSLEISCHMSEPFNSNNIKIWKGNSEVTTCPGDSYSCTFYRSGSRFTANITGAFGVISSLTPTDKGTWRCSYGTPEIVSSNTKNVIVYAIPSGLSITQNPVQDVDLSVISVELQCKTVGCTYPMPAVKWIFMDQSTSSEYVYQTLNPSGIQESCTGPEMIYTSTLTILRYTAFIDNSDKIGNFLCRIEYPVTSWNINSSPSNAVTFLVHVTSITLDKPDNIITVLDRTNIRLKCTASPSRPAPVIRWLLDGTEVTNPSSTTVTTAGNLFIASSELHLIIDRSHQDKKVYCDARVAGQVKAIESAKRTINVWYEPSIPSVQTVQGNNFPWLENQTGTLQCLMADPGNPKASVKWTSSRGTIDMDAYLMFRNLSAIDDGQPVYCQVQNNFTDIRGFTVVSPTILLNVEYRPTITLHPSVKILRIKEGSNLTVICLASGNPLPRVQWKNRNPPNNTLLIPNVLRSNTGSYTCVASSNSTNYNVVLQIEESLIVTVEYAPDVRVNITGSTVVGSTAVLTCTAQGEPPQYTFYPLIHRVGQIEIRRLNVVNTDSISSLTLSNISIQDMGSYICTVNNSITGLDGQIYQTGYTSLYVQGPPAFVETDSKITGEAGKPKPIEIPFYSNSSKTKVLFIKHSDSLEMSNTSNVSIYILTSNVTLTFYTKKEIILGHVAVLFFANVTNSDFDNYTLHLSNEKGNVTMVFDFIASGPPSRPKHFFFINIKDGFLVFGIQKGDNGGHDQTFVVEYRPSGNPEANWLTVLKINETNLEQSSTNGVYYIKIPKLQDGMYTFRVYAENVKGTSFAFEDVYANIKSEQQSAGNLPVPAITGGVIGATVLVIAIVVVLVIKRRSQGPGKKDFKEIHRDSNNGTEDSELKMNPIYNSSNSEPPVPVYAAVTKHKKPIGQNEDSNVYAQVDKSKGNKSKANKSKTPKGKPAKASRGDIYENSPLPLKNPEEFVYENPGLVATDPSESVYENPGPSASKGHLADKDGLQYAVLKLDPPTANDGKPVIHGLENRTEYAEVAYGKRGEPLPDSDEEKKDGAK